MQGIQLIAGLGNPGSQYAKTRHNVGAWFVEALAKTNHVNLREESKFQGSSAKIEVAGQECLLFVPSTFMNHSGRALSLISKFYKIAPENILIAHDELDLPYGSCRLKKGGGHAGHNGLRDIIHALGTADFYRLRIGIAHPGSKDKVVDYVLGTPGASEKQAILDSLNESMAIVKDCISGQFEKAMQTLHT